MIRLVALAAVVALALAGCHAPSTPGTTSSTTATPSPPPPFDGEGALALAASVVETGDDLRPRVPGTDRDATVAWLAHQLRLPGWTLTYENFTGSDVVEIGYGGAETYRRAPFCSEPDKTRAAGLAFTNVVATWDSPADATLLLASHWDAKRHATQDEERPEAVVPAANDGASGVGVLLRLAGHVAAGDFDPIVDLRIVLFDGEDGFEDCHPVAGSTFHAATAAPPDAMVLLDMVGDADARFVREGRSASSAPELIELVWGHGRSLGDAARFTDQACTVYDDHVPFVERGVPAVDLIDFGRGGRCSFPPYWHTSDDTVATLSAEALGHVGATMWATVTDPALAALLDNP